MSQTSESFNSASPILFHVDSLTLRHASGWAFSPATATPLIIEAYAGHQCIGRGVADNPRPDVGRAYPQYPLSASTGFYFELQTPTSGAGLNVSVVARSQVPETSGVLLQTRRFINRAGAIGTQSASENVNALVMSMPFPPRVLTAALARIEQDALPDSTPDEAEKAIVDCIASIAKEGDGLPFLVRYARFLRAALAHLEFVERYFPAANRLVTSDAKDYNSKPNTIEEMLSLSNHLYVLKFHGVQGILAEFGCFKGFSTSMLSYACHLLGIPMHVFDSFAGLPQSESTFYAAGEFCGSYEEVRNNVQMFGAPDAVTYHKGFFSDTLPGLDVPEIACLWMDVDLESSAKDVMTLLPKLDPRGSIFSHECEPGHFDGDTIVAGPDTVVLPILEAFDRIGAPAIGRFISGNTGAFWRSDNGVPVLSSRALLKLMSAI